MSYRWLTRSLISPSALTLLALGALAVAFPAGAQPLPASPARFVGSLDFHCFRMPTQHPLNILLTLNHLNPVLIDKGLPDQDVVLRDPQELCLPVQKNDEFPPTDVFPFLRYLDLECIGIEGPSLDLPLHIDHLNPVIQQLVGPTDDVIVREPQQLCVPVAKNTIVPPPEVRRLVQWLDVECFRVEARQPVNNPTITLTHLNPLFTSFAPYPVVLQPPTATQLCVPVAKNNRFPPDEIRRYVQWADVLCYNANGPVIGQQLRLTQLNPELVNQIQPQVLGPFFSRKLCVPVAKNGKFPPT